MYMNIKSLVIKLLILFFIVLSYYIGKIIGKKIYHNFLKKETFTTQELTPLCLPNINSYIYNRKDNQLPWCNKWKNNKHELKCYINKHLQRKCYWSCDNYSV